MPEGNGHLIYRFSKQYEGRAGIKQVLGLNYEILYY